MRTKTVSLNGHDVVIAEMKIKHIKDDLLPKLEPFWGAIVSSNTLSLIDVLGDQLKSVFPELAEVDLDDCYPSEIEGFVEAWIEVNFTGLKRLSGPVVALVKQGQLNLG